MLKYGKGKDYCGTNQYVDPADIWEIRRAKAKRWYVKRASFYLARNNKKSVRGKFQFMLKA